MKDRIYRYILLSFLSFIMGMLFIGYLLDYTGVNQDRFCKNITITEEMLNNKCNHNINCLWAYKDCQNIGADIAICNLRNEVVRRS